MLEASVQMGISLQVDELLKVRMVYVGVDTEEPLRDASNRDLEVFAERNSDFGREDGIIVQLRLDYIEILV